jgi:hypothetical protein
MLGRLSRRTPGLYAEAVSRVVGEPARDFGRGLEFKSQGGTSGRF